MIKNALLLGKNVKIVERWGLRPETSLSFSD